MTKRPGRFAAIVLLGATAASGCGKKGPPLAPFVRIPAAVETIVASRLGNDVYVTVTVPATNIDKSLPIDISRIDVYAYTGRVAPTPARWAELGNVVASIPVVPPTVGADGRPLPQAPSEAGAIPGTPVTVVDSLADDAFVQGPVPRVEPRFAPVTPISDAETATVLRRFYLAVPFSQRGRPGPPGAQAELVLTNPPDVPTDLRVLYAPASLSLAWEPSGGLIGFLLDRTLPPEPVPYDAPPPTAASTPSTATAVSSEPTTYNVYREIAPGPFALPPPVRPSWSTPMPAALNSAPLSATSMSDALDAGLMRCYTVRAQRGTLMSAASKPLCVTPVDTFPPAPPAGLAAVPSEGGISLIWEPNAELDLGGYLVLRREPGDATLRQLTTSSDRRRAVSRYRGHARCPLHLFDRVGGFASAAAKCQRALGTGRGNGALARRRSV